MNELEEKFLTSIDYRLHYDKAVIEEYAQSLMAHYNLYLSEAPKELKEIKPVSILQPLILVQSAKLKYPRLTL